MLGYYDAPSLPPDRIVTEPFPYARMIEAFGPALKFWEGAALTAWFLCEGPYSRTNMHGLERYHERELNEMRALGTPVDKAVFEELKEAQRGLGRKKPVYEKLGEREVAPSIVIETSTSYGYRREGFERLRDAVTSCRRAWANAYLEDYFKARSEGEIRQAATAYHISTQQRGGKPPTPKQFAKAAERTINDWFGGDMAMLYRAFGEKPPLRAEHTRLLPEDIESFATVVYWALGGTKLKARRPWDAPEPELNAHRQNEDRERARTKLARRVIDFLQLAEALGRAPTLKEFGQSGFEYEARAAFGQEAERAWPSYTRTVEEAASPLLARE